MGLLALLAAPASGAVGLKIGASRADLRGDSITEPVSSRSFSRSAAQDRDGLTFGVTLAAAVAPWLDACADVLYAPKGAAYDGTWGDQVIGVRSWSGVLKLDYLEVPVFARFALPDRAGVRPYLDLGLYVGILLDSHFESTSTDGTREFGASEYFSRVGEWDLGGVLGGGLEFGTGDRRYRVEFRYAPGLVHLERSGDTIQNTCVTLALALSV